MSGYFGSKAASGLCQNIIAIMPPHDTYIETHLGGGAVMKRKPPAVDNIGIDIDPQRIAEANANAERAGVQHLVQFIEQDALTVDVSEATVVTLYLLSSSNMKLRPLLTRDLPVGARIVSHAFSMGDWEPEVLDKFEDELGNTRSLYLWRHDGTERP